MAITPGQALDLTALLSQKIRDRRTDIRENVAYFKGTEGRMRFASDEFRDYFQARFSGFSDNWCAPVGQAPVERMHFLGVRPAGATSADAEAAATWERNDADRGLSEALLMMMVGKRSFGLVSPTPAGARITFENPDSAAVVYDPITRARRAGLVLWADDKTEYGQLLLPGSKIDVRREKVALAGGDRYVPPDADGWEFNPNADGVIETAHRLGVVPLVEYRNQSMLDDDPISDIAGVKAVQDAINLVWAYILNILDYTSLPGRAILGGERLMVPILDANGQKVGERPLDLDALIRDRQIHIPASASGQNPTIDEWSAADPSPLSAVIEQAVAHVAAQTRIPAYYLMAANVPATGWEVLDAGLVAKSSERIAYATAPTKEINRLTALADGDTARAAKIASGKALWRKPQYRSEEQLMDGLQKMRATGFPFEFIAEEYGLSPADVKRIMRMKRDEERDPYIDSLVAKEQASAVPDAPEVG